jgi:hypothetical protein
LGEDMSFLGCVAEGTCFSPEWDDWRWWCREISGRHADAAELASPTDKLWCV